MRLPLAPLLALALVPACASTYANAAPASGDPVAITSRPIPFSDSDPSATANGRLTYRGGIEIESDDPRFGGLSSLIVSADGTSMLAVSDVGYWFAAALHHEDGRLTGISDAHMSPLIDTDGTALAGRKIEGDAEGLTALDAFGFPGEVAVSFERKHRILRYAYAHDGMAARPVPIAMPAALSQAVNNGGIEALTVLPAEGNAAPRLIAITEATHDADGNMIGWEVTANDTRDLRLKTDEPFDLTDLARLPSGDVLTLERRYSILGGVGAQMRLIPLGRIGGSEPLDGEIVFKAGSGYSIDNMEGLDARKGEDGETFVYAVSDDNFNGLQRTLLLMFELTD